jgi:FkbH-like protein
MRVLPFNTLAQTLLSAPRAGECEVFLLLPWDFVPEADWRSGIPASLPPMDDVRRAAQRTADLLLRRPARHLLYLPAPLPPLSPVPAENAALAPWLVSLAMSLNAQVLPADAFSLGVYLAAGCPIGGAWLGKVSETVADLALSPPPASCKVLVTDLDDVLWSGVMAEDGLDGIAFGAEGSGYHHFIYQSLLAKLKRDGVLLCAVTRNDAQVAVEPLRSGRMVLREDDFVAVMASYQAKSAQIQQLAHELDLGLDAFVFVDDSPVELAEVSARLPAVRCLPFPASSEAVPAFCHELSRLFAKGVVTAEDAERTELYRRRMASLPPSEAGGADLTAFLRRLDMKLTIHDRSTGGWTRAAQLINKTTQFSLNGRKVTDEEVTRLLALGGRLYTASLEDRNGSHGEILACLTSAEGLVTSFAMSCRVLQRRVEHAFWVWLAGQPDRPRQLEFAATPRNEPFRHFLTTSAFGWSGEGPVPFDAARFAAAHAGELSLFTLSAPATVSRCA